MRLFALRFADSYDFRLDFPANGCSRTKIISPVKGFVALVNVLQVLAITSVGFVLFAVLWVTKVETYIEQREKDQTNRRSDEIETEART